jgi:hypothetical protein
MIIIASAIAGMLTGWVRAGRRGGNTKDRLHYAAIHAIAFTILGLIATLLIDRLD